MVKAKPTRKTADRKFFVEDPTTQTKLQRPLKRWKYDDFHAPRGIERVREYCKIIDKLKHSLLSLRTNTVTLDDHLWYGLREMSVCPTAEALGTASCSKCSFNRGDKVCSVVDFTRRGIFGPKDMESYRDWRDRERDFYLIHKKDEIPVSMLVAKCDRFLDDASLVLEGKKVEKESILPRVKTPRQVKGYTFNATGRITRVNGVTDVKVYARMDLARRAYRRWLDKLEL